MNKSTNKSPKKRVEHNVCISCGQNDIRSIRGLLTCIQCGLEQGSEELSADSEIYSLVAHYCILPPLKTKQHYLRKRHQRMKIKELVQHFILQCTYFMELTKEQKETIEQKIIQRVHQLNLDDYPPSDFSL